MDYSVCNKCARFCKFKPHYIAYIFACLLIKLCQFSICLTFLRNGLTLKEAGLISMEAGLILIEDGLISIETSGEHDVYILKFHDCNSYLKYLITQCWKMSGSASSTAARKFLTKYLPRKFSYILQEIPVIL